MKHTVKSLGHEVVLTLNEAEARNLYTAVAYHTMRNHRGCGIGPLGRALHDVARNFGDDTPFINVADRGTMEPV